ncbi:TetR/AcrR family transcriptional regulator [Proteocatella sphenisci]|uniref:TetR/AcrR family transcriptional regulator n=1 Tax=Proteocatella sphenisci TaxID=181070 RepID=UPI0004B22C1D|nr:TetR/AcrR family transcriptional regulator [Proteocatella sphenisci]
MEKKIVKTYLSNNKLLQKRRTVRYFIDAVKQIQEKEGLDAVNIRKIGDIAGYNSATIYNYFDSIEHLIFFASMEYFREYIKELPGALKDEKDSLERYIIIWNCFLKHAFRYPKNYYAIFLAKEGERTRDYIDDYYKLYPMDKSGMSQDIKDMMSEKDLFSRGNIAAKECIKQGYFSEIEGYVMNDIITYIFESFIFRVIHNGLDPETAETEIKRYIKSVIEKYRQK